MKGLLMINLGSPDSTSIPDVKKYLDEFLMDKRVIGKSYLFRWILVKLIILNTRPRKSAKAYKKIWWKEGSPLIVLSKRLFNKVTKLLDIPVALAMRYGSISIKKGLNELNKKGVKDVLVLPLYPHYAMSSYETVVEKVKEEKETNFPNLNIDIIPPFYKDKQYINILSAKIKESIKNVEYDHLLFSYHGIPVSHLKISDPTNTHCYKVNDCCNVDSQAHSTCYKHQCLETTKKVIEKLNIGDDKHSNSFQSRLPNEPWLKPYTDPTNTHCYKVNDCCNVDSQAHSTCYKHQCLETTKKVIEKLNIGDDKHSNSFQSRLPNEPWLKPYTDSELERLAKAGKKKLVIVTPAFVTDCLETLEEIAMEGKEEFLEAGGEQYTYVPCLNEDDNWAELISKWTKDYIKLN